MSQIHLGLINLFGVRVFWDEKDIKDKKDLRDCPFSPLCPFLKIPFSFFALKMAFDAIGNLFRVIRDLDQVEVFLGDAILH